MKSHFPWIRSAYLCAMRTILNVITCFAYIYYCKIKWNIHTYITNLVCTNENNNLWIQSINQLIFFLDEVPGFICVAEALVWLFHVCLIFLTKSVYNGFKVTMHKYFIGSSMNINISIEGLFLDVIGALAHQAMQTNYQTALTSGI